MLLRLFVFILIFIEVTGLRYSHMSCSSLSLQWLRQWTDAYSSAVKTHSENATVDCDPTNFTQVEDVTISNIFESCVELISNLDLPALWCNVSNKESTGFDFSCGVHDDIVDTMRAIHAMHLSFLRVCFFGFRRSLSRTFLLHGAIDSRVDLMLRFYAAFLHGNEHYQKSLLTLIVRELSTLVRRLETSRPPYFYESSFPMCSPVEKHEKSEVCSLDSTMPLPESLCQSQPEWCPSHLECVNDV